MIESVVASHPACLETVTKADMYNERFPMTYELLRHLAYDVLDDINMKTASIGTDGVQFRYGQWRFSEIS